MSTGREKLDQIVRGLDGVTADHERIWLEPKGAPDRCWCQDNQWGDEGVEYVRADLFRDLEERLAKAAEALETISSPTQTDNLLWWQVQARTALTTIRRTE